MLIEFTAVFQNDVNVWVHNPLNKCHVRDQVVITEPVALTKLLTKLSLFYLKHFLTTEQVQLFCRC